MIGNTSTKHISKSLDDTQKIARELLRSLTPVDDFAMVLFFSGELGSSKTTFTKLLARELGITETVISPTFILEKKYTIKKHPHFKTLVHIDAYRFDTPSEAKVLRLEDTLKDPHTLVVIEWPEKLGKKIIPTKKVSFKSLSENSKQIIW